MINNFDCYFYNCIMCDSNKNVLEQYFKDAEALFRIMRDATDEEQVSVNAYIKSISKDTGVDFFDIC